MGRPGASSRSPTPIRDRSGSATACAARSGWPSPSPSSRSPTSTTGSGSSSAACPCSARTRSAPARPRCGRCRHRRRLRRRLGDHGRAGQPLRRALGRPAIAVLLPVSPPTAISFAAGQAGFTVVVIVLFNIIEPTGWKVGLTRIEDVAIGCAVSLVVGFLFWPRGADGRAGPRPRRGVRGRVRVPAPGGRADDVAGRHARHRRRQARHRRPLRPARRTPSASTWANGARSRSARRSQPPSRSAPARTRVEAYSLATLPRRPVEAGQTPLASVVTAGDSLRAACADAHQWYLDVAAVLAGRHGTAPPRRQHEGPLHQQLVAAFVDSSREHRLGDVRAVLRMLWADESLEDELALQHELAGAVERFAQRRRWAGYARPVASAPGAPTSGDGAGGGAPGGPPGQLAGADEPSAI